MDLSIMKKISSHWSKTTYNIPINQNTPQVFLLLLIGTAFVVIQIILRIHAQLEVLLAHMFSMVIQLGGNGFRPTTKTAAGFLAFYQNQTIT